MMLTITVDTYKSACVAIASFIFQSIDMTFAWTQFAICHYLKCLLDPLFKNAVFLTAINSQAAHITMLNGE